MPTTAVPRVTHDFVLQFGPVSGSGYAVNVIESRAGNGSGLFVPPFGPNHLSELLAPSRGRDISFVARESRISSGRPTMVEAERSGAALFQAVFSGKVGDLYQQSLALAGTAGLRLQLKFDLEQHGLPGLSNLPWELLFRPGTRSFLALKRVSPIFRHLDVEHPFEPAPLQSPLRMLALLAEPSGLPRLNLTGELRNLERMLSGRRRIEIDVCLPADPADLRTALLEKPYHVFHYMGHGDYDPLSGEGSLWFAARNGAARMVRGRELATALDGFPSLRMAVLNACSTARTAVRAAGNPFAGVAAALAQIGLPAVIAMQTSIADRLAIAFATEFYRRLLQGETAEVAVVEGRHAIFNEEPDTPAWATPALFQRRSEVRLFSGLAPDAGVESRRRLEHHLARVAEEMREPVTPPVASLGLAPTVTLDQVFIPSRCRRLSPYVQQEGSLVSDLPAAAKIMPLSQHQGAIAIDVLLAHEHLVVLLGEVGSGKSAQLRHLAAQLALARRTHDKAGRLAIQPTSGENGAPTPPVPILVRAADFAAAKTQDPLLTLTAFLARTVGLGETGGTDTPGTLLEMLLDWLEAGEVVALIDGLDEIDPASDRDDFCHQIELFAASWCPAGNRLIVTTRAAGTVRMPHGPWATCYVLEPFGSDEIRSFCDRWRQAVHLSGTVLLPVADRLAGAVAPSVEDLQCPDASGPLSNPLLLTLACILWQQGGALPYRRVGLYAATADVLLEQWERRGLAQGGLPLGKPDILAILAELAAAAHERHSEVDPRQLRSQLARRFPTQDPDRLCHTILGQSGFLIPFGQHSYRFHPASFEDYFTARALAVEPGKAGSRILARALDPHWRRPILMAMGILSEELDEGDFRDLLLAMLYSSGPMEALLPVGAMCVAASLSEIERVPSGVAGAVASRLLTAYADCGHPDRAPALRLPIERAFRALLSGQAAQSVDRVLIDALDTCDGEEDRAPAVASLLWRIGHLSPELAERLASAADRDTQAWGWPIGSALRSIAARSPELLADPPASLRRTLSRRPDLVARVLADPSWLALIFALFGGFAPGRGFAPERISRHSPLTPMILSALEAAQPAHGLVPALWHWWRAQERDAGAGDALLALAALGEAVGVELRRARPSSDREAGRIAEVSHLLVEALTEADRSALEALRVLAGQCPSGTWSELLATVLETINTGGGPPLELIALESAAAPEARPPLFSEVWHASLAGPEPIYNFAVLLDVAGAALSDPEVLAASLAGAGEAVHARGSLTKGWPIERPAFRSRHPADVLQAALDALTVLADSFDFVRGWALACLARPLAEHELTAEAAVLAAGSLSDRFGARARALHALLGAGAGAMERSDPESALLPLVQATANDALRLRGYLQLIRYFPSLRQDLLCGSQPAIQSLAHALSDPRERVANFLKLADLDAPGSEAWVGLAHASARRIVDPDDRARALCRLVARVPRRKVRRLCRLAVRAAASIADTRRRAETLAALRETLPADSVVRARLIREAQRLDDPWQRSRALGTLAPRLWSYAREIAGRQGIGTPLLLAAIWADQESEMPGDHRTPWTLPATAPTPGPGVELSALTVSGLLADLALGDDLAHSQAALALHGDRSDGQRNASATVAGRRTLEILAGAWIDALDSKPQIAQVIGWTLERIRHDDRGAITAWADCLGDGTPGAKVAEILLSQIHDLHPRVWPELCEALRWSPTPVKRALLRSLCFLLARRRLPDDRWPELQHILDGWDPQEVGSDEIDLELPASLVSAAEAGQRVLSHQPGAVEEAVAAADKFLVASPFRLANALQEPPEIRRQTLAAVGALRVAPAGHWRRLAAAAERIGQAPQCLDVLLPWLAARLGRDLQDRFPFRTVVSDLIGLVAAVAEREPKLFRRQAEKLPNLRRRLRESVELHNSYGGRRDALRMLAHLRRVTPDCIAAVRSSLRDVAEVQAEALRCLDLFRESGPEALSQLLSALRDPSAVAACAAARLLTALIAANGLPAEARTVIAETVTAVMREPASRRRVHQLVVVRKQIRIESRLRLDDDLASLLVELAGFRNDPSGSDTDRPEEPV